MSTTSFDLFYTRFFNKVEKDADFFDYYNHTEEESMEIAKQRAIIEAQAAAETIRENAKGEADAIFAKMEAEAKGLFEILTKQAEGDKEVVAAAGGDPTKAFQLLLIEKLPE